MKPKQKSKAIDVSCLLAELIQDTLESRQIDGCFLVVFSGGNYHVSIEMPRASAHRKWAVEQLDGLLNGLR